MPSDSRFTNEVLARLPYSRSIIDSVSSLNPKYDYFNELTRRKVERLSRQSIAYGNPSAPSRKSGLGIGDIMHDMSFFEFMYAGVDRNDKIRRLQEYRKMVGNAEFSNAIDKICDECIVYNTEDSSVVQFNVGGEHDRDSKKEIKKEWSNFIQYYQLEDKGWEYFRQFLTDGEIFFENVISQNRPDYGILGVLNIPTELISPIYDNVQNDIIKGFVLRKPIKSEDGKKIEKEQLIPMEPQQITYIHSGIWNSDRTVRLPYIEAARRPYKQLSLIEDSIVIYRLVRAPERLVFKVDVGNMNVPESEAYLKRLMHQYWNKKSFDFSGDGGVHNAYNPQSMLDAFWFPTRNGQSSTDVTTLPGGSNLGQLDDLNYFIRKLYQSLKIPISRMDPASVFSDGTTITREELEFATFIMRIQRNFAMGIKNAFITHLKLRNLWDEYELVESDVNIKFNTPTSFGVMREQQVFAIKLENFNSLSNNEGIATSFAQRYYLGWNDSQMGENRAWLRKDAELQWELEQLRTQGPEFNDSQSAMAQASAELRGGSGGSFSPELPPDFGPGPETGGEEQQADPAAGSGEATPPPQQSEPAPQNQNIV